MLFISYFYNLCLHMYQSPRLTDHYFVEHTLLLDFFNHSPIALPPIYICLNNSYVPTYDSIYQLCLPPSLTFVILKTVRFFPILTKVLTLAQPTRYHGSDQLRLALTVLSRCTFIVTLNFCRQYVCSRRAKKS